MLFVPPLRNLVTRPEVRIRRKKSQASEGFIINGSDYLLVDRMFSGLLEAALL